MRPARRTLDAVAVVVDRVDARIVADAELAEDVERPQRAVRDREERGAMANHAGPGEILQHLDRTLELGAEHLGPLGVDQGVRPAVGGDLVPGGGDVAHQGGMPLGGPSQHEERRSHPGVGQHLQRAVRRERQAVLEAVPAVRRDLEPLVPVLPIDRERVDDGRAHAAIIGRFHAQVTPAIRPIQRDLRAPAGVAPDAAGIADQVLHVGGAHARRIRLDADGGVRPPDEPLDHVRQPHAGAAAHVVRGAATPALEQYHVGARHVAHVREVARHVQVADPEHRLEAARFDGGDLPREAWDHESRVLAGPGVRERARADHVLAALGRDRRERVGRGLGQRIGTHRPERSVLGRALAVRLRPVDLAARHDQRACLRRLGVQRLEQMPGPDRVHPKRLRRPLERERGAALPRQVQQEIRPRRRNGTREALGIVEVRSVPRLERGARGRYHARVVHARPARRELAHGVRPHEASGAGHKHRATAELRHGRRRRGRRASSWPRVPTIAPASTPACRRASARTGSWAPSRWRS